MTLPSSAAAAARVATKAADAADSGNSLSSPEDPSVIFRRGGGEDYSTERYPSVPANTSSSSRFSRGPSYATPRSAAPPSLQDYSPSIPGGYSPTKVPFGESPMKSAPSLTTTTAGSSTVPPSPPPVKSSLGIHNGEQSPFGAQERLSWEAEEILAREMLATSSASARSAARRKERLERKEKRSAAASKRSAASSYLEAIKTTTSTSKRLSRRERRWPEEEYDANPREPKVRGSGSVEPRDRRRDEEYIQPPPVSSIGVDPIKVEKASEGRRRKKEVPTTPTERSKTKDSDLDRWINDETLVRINVLTSHPSGVREPTEFYIPASLVVQREKEMRSSARKYGIDMNRWSGSLLVRKLKELQIQEEIQHLERKLDTLGVPTLDVSPGEESPHNVMNAPDVGPEMYKQSHEMYSLESASFDDRRMSSGVGKPYIFFLDPEAECSSITNQTNSLTWTPALTSCIRSYYNTGTIRVADECLGNDVLVALEYFGIVYAPDQLAFDTFGCYLRVKLWSDYYTHRTALADWVIRRLMGTHSRHSHGFVTSPEPREGQHYLGNKKLELLDGGLDLDSSKLGESSEGQAPPSCSVVHEFFNNDDEENVPSSASISIASPSDSIDAVLRRDFRGYLQNSLPGTTVSFGLREVTVAPGMNATSAVSSTSLVVTRAVLHVDFNTNPLRKTKKNGTPPDLGGTTFIVKTDAEDGGTVISALEDEVEVESFVEKQLKKSREKAVSAEGQDTEVDRIDEGDEKEEPEKEEHAVEEVSKELELPGNGEEEELHATAKATEPEEINEEINDEDEKGSKADSTHRLVPLQPLDTVQENKLLEDNGCEEKEDETYDLDTSIEPDLPLKHVRVSKTGDQKSVFSALSGPFRDGDKEVSTPEKSGSMKDVDVSALTDTSTTKDVKDVEDPVIETPTQLLVSEKPLATTNISTPATNPMTPCSVQPGTETSPVVAAATIAPESRSGAPEVNKWIVSPEQSPLEAVGLTDVFSMKGIGSFDLSTSARTVPKSNQAASNAEKDLSARVMGDPINPTDASTTGEGTIESMTNKITKMIFGGTDRYVGRSDKYDIDAVNPDTNPGAEALERTELQHSAGVVPARRSSLSEMNLAGTTSRPTSPPPPENLRSSLRPTSPSPPENLTSSLRPTSPPPPETIKSILRPTSPPPPDYLRPQSPGVLSFRSDVTGGTRPRDLPRSLGADRTQLLEVKSMVSNSPTEPRNETVDDVNAAWLRGFLCPNCFADSPMECFSSIDEAALEAATRKGASEKGDVPGTTRASPKGVSGAKSPLTLPKVHTREVLGKEYGVEVRPSKSFGARSVVTEGGDRKSPAFNTSSSLQSAEGKVPEHTPPSRKSPLTVMPVASGQQLQPILKSSSTALPGEAAQRPPIVRSHSTMLPEDNKAQIVSHRSFSPTMGVPGNDPAGSLEMDKKSGRRLQNLLGFKKRFGRS